MRLAQNAVGPFVAVPFTSAQVTLTGRQASATYEVTATDAGQVESAKIPVTVSAPAGTTAAPLTVTAALAPQSTVLTASATAPVPRFSDKSAASSTTATIVACPPSGGGQPLGGGGQPGVKVVSISGLLMTHRRFAVARATSAVSARAPRGTAFRYTLSGAATVRIAIGRVVIARHKRTTHTLIVLTRRDAAGAEATSFSGRTRTKTLGPGTYVASVTASNSAGKSAARTISFTVLSR